MVDTSPRPFATNITPEVITARLDRLTHLTGKHKVIVALLVTIFLFDIIDLASFGFVAPGIAEAWGLSVTQLGVLNSTAFVGMFLGGLLGGRLADRYGRRPMILIGVVIFSLASLFSALAQGPEVLAVLRLATGFGLQTTMGAVLVMVSESFPKALRGRTMALILGLSYLGGPILGIVARIFVPIGQWHMVFVLGGLGLIPALIGLKVLPESPRWLAVNGRGKEADAQLQFYERQFTNARGQLAEPVVDATPVPVNVKMRELFTRTYLSRTIVAMLAFSTLILLAYGFSAWAPTILVSAGYSSSDALLFAAILSLSGPIGAVLTTTWVDRFERKTSIFVALAIMVFCYLLIAFTGAIPVLLVAGFLGQMAMQSITAVMYSYVPEMFPVAVRGAGTGIANGTARIAGIFSGILITSVLAGFGVTGVFVYLAAVGVIMFVVLLFGPNTGIRKAHLQNVEERAQALR